MAWVLKVNPVILMIAIPAIALTEIWLIVTISQIVPNAITGLFVFSITMAVFTTVSAVFEHKLKVFGWWYRGLALILAMVLGVGWVFQTNYLISNLTAIIAVVGLLIILPDLSPKTVVAICVGIVAYDILGVWVTGLIVKLAFGLAITPPAMVTIPLPAVGAETVAHYAALGLGDFAFGILIALTMVANRSGKLLPIILFGLSVLAAYVIVAVTQGPVPATVTIVPIMLAGLWATIRNKKEEAALAAA